MKKLLFAAILFASTTFGFAKDNVQNSKSTYTESSKVESKAEKTQIIYQFDTLVEAQKFLKEREKECKDVIVVTTIKDGQTVITSIHESTVPCIMQPEGTVNVYVISA